MGGCDVPLKLIFTFLSFSKGLRAQIDRDQYRRHMQEEIKGVAGLEIREDSVEDLVLSGGHDGNRLTVTGVCLGKIRLFLESTGFNVIVIVLLLLLLCCIFCKGSGETIPASSVILTTGTFLRGVINIGMYLRCALNKETLQIMPY